MIKGFIDNYLKKFQPYKENKCWCYEDGVILTAALNMYQVFQDEEYLRIIDNYLESHVDKNGNMYLYEINDFNIDNIQPGRVLFYAYQKLRKEKYLLAADILYKQLMVHPRTNDGNFFHKKRYPYQVWLDGLYMAMPFYALYAKKYNKKAIYKDIIHQFEMVRQYLFDENRKLYVHAYDEKRQMQWADKVTGKSPNVWSRSVGWLAMALIDVYEIIRYDINASKIAKLFKELVTGMIKYQDKKTDMWYQIVDQPTLEGNYLETSGTSMIAYALLKAYRLGVVNYQQYIQGKKAYYGTIKKYFKKDNGEYKLYGICKVAGLDNEKRDGSIEYYLSEEVVANDSKGVAPFVMAFCEMLKGEV